MYASFAGTGQQETGLKRYVPLFHVVIPDISLQHKILASICRDDRADERIFERSIEIEKNKDPLERLHAREAMEFNIDTASALSNFAHSGS